MVWALLSRTPSRRWQRDCWSARAMVRVRATCVRPYASCDTHADPNVAKGCNNVIRRRHMSLSGLVCDFTFVHVTRCPFNGLRKAVFLCLSFFVFSFSCRHFLCCVPFDADRTPPTQQTAQLKTHHPRPHHHPTTHYQSLRTHSAPSKLNTKCHGRRYHKKDTPVVRKENMREKYPDRQDR